MLDIETAHKLAIDMQVVAAHRDIQNMPPAWRLDAALILIGRNPRLAQDAKNAMAPIAPGVNVKLGTVIEVGMRIRTQFNGRGRDDGHVAEFRNEYMNDVLVPEKSSGWKPAYGVWYTVMVTRQIGQGRRPVWLCRPVVAESDLRRHLAGQSWWHIYWPTIQKELTYRQVDKALLANGITLEEHPIKEARRKYVEKESWGKLAEPETLEYRPNGSSVKVGIADATWRGQAGTYRRTVERYSYIAPAGHSDDGFRRWGSSEEWAEQTKHAELISGIDVIALRKQAEQSEIDNFNNAVEARNAARAERRKYSAMVAELIIGTFEDSQHYYWKPNHIAELLTIIEDKI